MKVSPVLLIAISFITLNGSCRLNAAQAAESAASATKENVQPAKPDPRFAGIPAHHHAYLKTLEKTAPRMMTAWLKARALYKEVNHYANVFGLRERKSARKKVPRLLAKAQSEEQKFRKAYDRFRKPIEKEESDIKERAMTLSEKKGALTNARINKQIDELYDKAYTLGEQLNALTALQGVFHRSATVPTALDHLGISAHDSIATQMARDNPKLIEARLLIKDCQVDIATVEKRKAEIEADPKRRWSSSDKNQLKKLNSMLEKAVALLEREAEKAKAPFLRDAAKFEKKIATTQEKIEKFEKSHRNTSSYYDRLTEYDGALQENLDAAAMIDTLATWKKADKKAPAKKKGGH